MEVLFFFSLNIFMQEWQIQPHCSGKSHFENQECWKGPGMTLFFPNERFGKMKSGPGGCERSGRSVVANLIVARAKPTINIFTVKTDMELAQALDSTALELGFQCLKEKQIEAIFLCRGKGYIRISSNRLWEIIDLWSFAKYI